MKALRTFGLLAAILGLAMLASAGLGTRFGVWHYRTGLTMMRWSAWVGIAAAVLTMLGLFARPRGAALLGSLGALVAAVLTFAVPYSFQRTARAVPPIHDITTDMVDPPAFVDVLPLRADAPNSAEYAGDSIATLQRAAYPDVQPLTYGASPAAVFDAAREAAESMGWALVAADSASGRIEATATTTWFGFKDDVVIRVRAEGTGSRVDVRSVSRVGRSDVGANAARIRAYAEALTRRVSSSSD
jgi:uncharacterized protein (DUF1499 family)